MKSILPLILLVAACSGGAKAKGPAAPAAPAAYTLVSVDQGDIACYVVVKDATGAEYTYPGTFELCPGGGTDATPLVGQTVALSFEKGNIQAASCEGDPECADTEETEIVMTITAAP